MKTTDQRIDEALAIEQAHIRRRLAQRNDTHIMIESIMRWHPNTTRAYLELLEFSHLEQLWREANSIPDRLTAEEHSTHPTGRHF